LAGLAAEALEMDLVVLRLEEPVALVVLEAVAEAAEADFGSGS